MQKMSSKFRSRLAPFLREYQFAKSSLKSEALTLSVSQEELSAAEEAQGLVQSAAEEVQNTIHSRIGVLVSKALKAVFLDEAYEFQLKFEQKRSKTEANMVFLRDGIEFSKPTEESGVGQIEVAAFALRIACLMLLRPKKRLLMIADEPWKNINGPGHRKRAAQLLVDLSKEFKVQMIISTGLDWLKGIGKQIHIEKD